MTTEQARNIVLRLFFRTGKVVTQGVGIACHSGMPYGVSLSVTVPQEGNSRHLTLVECLSLETSDPEAAKGIIWEGAVITAHDKVNPANTFTCQPSDLNLALHPETVPEPTFGFPLVNGRQELSNEVFEEAIRRVRVKLYYRLRQKGRHAYASNHETLGLIGQELREFDDAVHDRLPKDALNEELLDVAVGAVWGVASNMADATDW